MSENGPRSNGREKPISLSERCTVASASPVDRGRLVAGFMLVIRLLRHVSLATSFPVVFDRNVVRSAKKGTGYFSDSSTQRNQ
jgi:hypothetical protein